jgi:hypothetical protein
VTSSRLPDSINALLPEDGFVRKFVEYAFPLTDAPPESHIATALGVVSALVGTSVKIPFGPGILFLNVWMVVIGLSSYARKTTSQRMGDDIVRRVSPDCILPDDTTPQALFGLLVEQPARVLFLSEFAWLLEQLEVKFNAGLKALITDLFDVPPSLERARASRSAGEQITAVNRPYLTILAATTAHWLNGHLNDADLSGGFYARFIYWPAGDKHGRRIAIPPRLDERIRDDLVVMAQSIAQLEGELALDLIADQYECWHAAHAAEFLTLDDRERLGPFWIRLETYCLKFAALYQLAEGPAVPCPKYTVVRFAENIARGCVRSVSRSRLRRERVLDRDAGNRLAGVQVLGQELRCPTPCGDGHDQRVPRRWIR